jgi:hypothetical protein
MLALHDLMGSKDHRTEAATAIYGVIRTFFSPSGKMKRAHAQEGRRRRHAMIRRPRCMPRSHARTTVTTTRTWPAKIAPHDCHPVEMRVDRPRPRAVPGSRPRAHSSVRRVETGEIHKGVRGEKASQVARPRAEDGLNEGLADCRALGLRTTPARRSIDFIQLPVAEQWTRRSQFPCMR